ncbi:metal-dependent hydrolase [Sphingomonas sp. LB-2]|uniref:metal-dependent hydrolase n=1 Tax=Sphingomonas caeni TaxID=2984949 RepID=UPI00222F6C64|nr:metal-dependent hydrolase [Sphingomonas caeni]MCW3848272.1 metal-dependent hydrolase [Sphingomonas caeni]
MKAKTPADLTITPRDRRFGREAKQDRWWFAGDPVATAFHNSLSITFPKGEAMFIESVKAFREGTPPKLDAEIRAFVQQEVMHSREHVAFNRRVTEAGYDFAPLEAVVDEILAIIKTRPPIVNLAATMALEHYTAILASVILGDRDYFKGVDREQADMWRWHAIEELEHKGVAYDTWLHATKDWSKWRRWKLKSLMMLLVTVNFWKKRVAGAAELLRQDGITRWGRARVWWYLIASPGLLRKIFFPWVAYFLPGFHPWNHDDRHLIGKAESDYQAAVLAAA